MLHKTIQMTNDWMEKCSASSGITGMHSRAKWNTIHSKE